MNFAAFRIEAYNLTGLNKPQNITCIFGILLATDRNLTEIGGCSPMLLTLPYGPFGAQPGLEFFTLMDTQPKPVDFLHPLGSETPPDSKSGFLKIDFHSDEGMTSIFANHVTVMQDNDEAYISFYELIPPMIMEPGDAERVLQLKSIRANCVARIAISKSRLQGIVDAINASVDPSKTNVQFNSVNKNDQQG